MARNRNDLLMGARIKETRTALRMSQEAFGTLFGVSQEAVSGWEHGSYPDLQILLEIARRGNSTVEWLVTGKRKESGAKTALLKKRPEKTDDRMFKDSRNYKPFPLLYEEISKGPPKVITKDDVEEYLWLAPIFQRKNILLIRQKDDSMDPILPKEGVAALSEWPEDTFMLKKFVAAAWLPEDGLIIRWLSSNRNQWILRPQNSSYPPVFINKKKAIRFFRVVWWWGIPEFLNDQE